MTDMQASNKCLTVLQMVCYVGIMESVGCVCDHAVKIKIRTHCSGDTISPHPKAKEYRKYLLMVTPIMSPNCCLLFFILNAG